MSGFTGKIFKFIKREKIYIFLLIFIILMHFSFSFLDRLLQDSGIGKLFEKPDFAEESIISEEKMAEVLSADPGVYFLFIALFTVFIFFAMLGLAFDILYLRARYKKREPLAKTQLVETVKWDFWDICKVALIFLFAYDIVWLADIFFFSGIPYLNLRQSLKVMLSATLVDIIAIGAILYFVLRERRQGMVSLGLTGRRFFVNLKYGVCAYIGLIPILALTMFLVSALFNKLNIPLEPQPVLVILKEENHIPSLVYMGLFTSFFGPVLEEIFFRGFAYGVFKKRLGVFGGIAISAVFFAYVHANMASFFPIFCLGVLLAYLYEKTGSLIPSITVHVMHNSLTLFFFLIFKWIGL